MNNSLNQNTVEITEKDMKDVFCSNCGGQFFTQCVAIKQLSSLHPMHSMLVQQNGSDYMPIPISYVCMKCGQILNENKENKNENKTIKES